MLHKLFYRWVQPVLEAVGRILAGWGVRPNQLTFIGLGFNALACGLYAQGAMIWASAVVLFAGLFDLLDGPLARASGRVSAFGGFIDSVVDRYSDILIFGGVLVYWARMGRTEAVILCLAVLAGALLTSYTKARAENVIDNCRVGWIERPERVVILGLGGLSGWLVPALWILAIGTHATALARILYTRKRLQAG